MKNRIDLLMIEKKVKYDWVLHELKQRGTIMSYHTLLRIRNNQQQPDMHEGIQFGEIFNVPVKELSYED